MQEMTLQEMHEAELHVLKEVDGICRELGLKYWIMFGTLIGAVRHHGFIPWDDDLDVVMKRDDFDKLIQYFVANGGSVKDLHLDHSLTVKTYTHYIARISENKNHLVFHDEHYTSGIFIDIYPMDGLAKDWYNSWQRKILDRIINIKYSYTQLKDGKLPDSEPTKKVKVSFWRKVLAYVREYMSKVPFAVKMRYRILDMLARRYKFDKSEYVGIPGQDLAVCWKREFFDDTVYFKFEDFEVPAPVGYDELLRDHYGDYMQLPPEDKRQPHHDYIAYKP